MSVFAVTNRRGQNPAVPTAQLQEGIAGRTRRALVLSGWLALILGQALGLLMVNPGLLTSHLPFALDPGVIALSGFGLTGLLTGVVAGLALRGASAPLRWAVAVFGVMVGLIVFEIVYGLMRGMTLVTALLADDTLKVSQMGLGILCASIGVLAGRGGRPRVTTRASTAQPSARRQPATHPLSRPASRSQERQPTRAQGRQQPSSSRTPQRQARGRSASRGSASAAASPAPLTIGSTSSKTSRPGKRRKRLGFMRRQVHLGREQTAMCPYCLEEVTHNDPRGKVVCRICGTPHHADCWAITGKCEVPHLQT